MANSRVAKKLSYLYPPLKDEGVDYLLAAAKGGLGAQVINVVQVGASPFTVNLVAQGGKEMHDGTYFALVQGPGGDEYITPASCTATQLQVTGAAAAESLRILIVGRMKDQASAS